MSAVPKIGVEMSEGEMPIGECLPPPRNNIAATGFDCCYLQKRIKHSGDVISTVL